MSKRFSIATCLILLVGLVGFAAADIAPISHQYEPVGLKSGVHSGNNADAYIAYSTVLDAGNVPWVRLYFSSVNLGEASYITITSLQDGGYMPLNSQTMQEWYNSSAYFNGGSVEINLHVAPNDADVYFEIDEVMVGEHTNNPPIESQCGPLDDRVPSSDPAVARAMNVGCTAWLIDNNKVATAGHCISIGPFSVIQFNVPNSTGGGTPVNPGPEDQYSVNTGTWVWTWVNEASDWGVFEVFDNAISGLQPHDVQGAFFDIKQDLGPANIRITGYGLDFNDAELSQTQQTHVGPNDGSFGTVMQYKTDTEGGNSGSPIIDDATGESVGVHGYGGCSTTGSGNNSGTSFFNTAFWDAANDGGTGGIDCADVRDLRARCTLDGGSRLQSMLRFWNSNYSGDQVTFRINGSDDHVVNVVNSRAVLSLPGYGVGTHTIEVLEVNHCIGSENATCTSSAVADADWDAAFEAAVPEITALAGNYPNPFNPTTTIDYALASDVHVTIKVFNMLGQEVNTLVDGAQSAGYHDVQWNGTSNSGQAVASGTYVLQMRAGNVVQTRTMSFMK